MLKNYYLPKKQYEQDIKFLNEKFGTLMEERFQNFLKMNTPYNSSVLSIYFKKEGFVSEEYFTHESLSDLEIVRDIRAAGLEIHHMNIVFQKANALAELHIDNGADPRHASFNLPLKGCTGSKIIWIRSDQFPKMPPQNNDFDVISNNAKKRNLGSLPTDVQVIRDDTTWDVIDEVGTDQAIILKTDTWHAVDNRNNQNYRFVFAVRFDKNPEFDDVVLQISKIGL